jgi:phage I-like protein
MIKKRFRIFKKGLNTNTNGAPILFDEKSAELVMAHFKRHGTDLMIDLEHLSLNKESKAYDPDARGWTRLEIFNGELWATVLDWTADGERRIKERLQKYISPAFLTDKENRATRIVNMGLTALPATDFAMPLTASGKLDQDDLVLMSININEDEMDLTPLLELLGLPADATIEDIVEACKALMVQPEEASEETEEKPEEKPEEASEETEEKPEEKMQAASVKAIAKLSQQVEDLKRQNEVDRLISANTDKISPALEEWARTLSVKQLKDFLGNTQPVKTFSQKTIESATGGLTKEEEHLIKLCGVSREKLLAYKGK